MRYTTIIDVSSIQELYKNRNAVLLYCHLVFKSGYYDYNKDAYKRSIRGLALDLNMTLSATRHAIGILQKHKLITQKDGWWLVRKYIKEQTISSRISKKQQQRNAEIEERLKQQQQLDKSIKEREENAISYEEYKRQKNQEQ